MDRAARNDEGGCLMSQAIRTTCAYCGVGCGIAATPTGGRAVKIRGDEAHPANGGKLCSKGTHLGETVGLEGRLLYPMIGDRRASWARRWIWSPSGSATRSPGMGRTASPSMSPARY